MNIVKKILCITNDLYDILRKNSQHNNNKGKIKEKQRKIAKIKEKQRKFHEIDKIEENSENKGKWVPCFNCYEVIKC